MDIAEWEARSSRIRERIAERHPDLWSPSAAREATVELLASVVRRWSLYDPETSATTFLRQALAEGEVFRDRERMEKFARELYVLLPIVGVGAMVAHLTLQLLGPREITARIAA